MGCIVGFNREKTEKSVKIVRKLDFPPKSAVLDEFTWLYALVWGNTQCSRKNHTSGVGQSWFQFGTPLVGGF